MRLFREKLPAELSGVLRLEAEDRPRSARSVEADWELILAFRHLETHVWDDASELARNRLTLAAVPPVAIMMADAVNAAGLRRAASSRSALNRLAAQQQQPHG